MNQQQNIHTTMSHGARQNRGFFDFTMRPMTIQQERMVPNWFTGRAMVFFFVAFAACTFVFGYPMEFPHALVASLSILLFFYGAKTISRSWERTKEKTFLKYIFITGLVLRLAWILYCYFYANVEYFGNTYGDDTDTQWYVPFGQAIAEWVKNGFPISFSKLMDNWAAGVDDVGYPLWLGIVYFIFGVENEVFIPYVVKCIIGAYCSISVYNIAKRHFGEGVARMAAIFVALNPNMIYWCGNMFKETEMVFLCCLCLDLVDRTFTSGKRLTFKTLLPGILVGFMLFFFRAALATVIFIAMGAHIVMASNRVMSMGKKIIAGAMVAVTLLVGIGDSLREQTQSMYDSAQSDYQKTNMEWRSKREGGNSFAKYAGKAVFAPLIFTIPFPTFNVAEQSQVLQRQLSGGSYIKNILSFFVIMMMVMLLISSEWRRHVFILAYTVGYHVVLALSPFAQSGRFHMPVWPMLLLFAAYGIQIAKTNGKVRKWFPIVLVAEVVICLGWNWFKLKGRGMI